MTPPVEPPYSAGYPVDLTCTSSTKSASRSLSDAPPIMSVVSMPSMMNRFSAPEEPSIMMPFDLNSWLAPGACTTSDEKSRLCGSSSICSARMLAARALDFTSTSGDSPSTVTTSLTPASDKEKSTDLMEPSETTTFETLEGLKLARVAVISYAPGSTDGKRYEPLRSVVVVSTPLPELWASTVTPGRTPPDVSFTTPSILPRCSWAAAADAVIRTAKRTAAVCTRMNPLLLVGGAKQTINGEPGQRRPGGTAVGKTAARLDCCIIVQHETPRASPARRRFLQILFQLRIDLEAGLLRGFYFAFRLGESP